MKNYGSDLREELKQEKNKEVKKLETRVKEKIRLALRRRSIAIFLCRSLIPARSQLRGQISCPSMP
jgi:hypothetical protein